MLDQVVKLTRDARALTGTAVEERQLTLDRMLLSLRRSEDGTLTQNGHAAAGIACSVGIMAYNEDENIAEMDLFVAVTNDDENNIMSSLLAKRMGARKVIALINRSSYVNLVQAGQIDIAISPAQATIGTLLARVRRGDCVAVHSLRRGAAEALELVAHGDRKSSKVVGRKVEELDLPKGATIGAIVRRHERASRADLQPTYDLLADIPAGKTVVSESGIRYREQIEELEQVGVDAVLIGEPLMRAEDPEAAVRELTRSEEPTQA